MLYSVIIDYWMGYYWATSIFGLYNIWSMLKH